MQREKLLKELTFKSIRSSGAGGQHVNKVSSKVVFSFDVFSSNGLNKEEKLRLYNTLGSRLTKEKILLLGCDETKSQLQNKTRVIERFLEILTAGLQIPKRRIASKPSKASVKRMKEKKRFRGEIKKSRRKPDIE